MISATLFIRINFSRFLSAFDNGRKVPTHFKSVDKDQDSSMDVYLPFEYLKHEDN